MENRIRIVSDLDIQALTDGELEGDEKTFILAAIQADVALQARYKKLLAQKQILMRLMDDDLPSSSLH